MPEKRTGRPVLRGLAIGLVLSLTALALLGGLVTLCSRAPQDPNRPAGSTAPQVQRIGREQLRPNNPATHP